jgi:hypothetical protein
MTDGETPMRINAGRLPKCRLWSNLWVLQLPGMCLAFIAAVFGTTWVAAAPPDGKTGEPKQFTDQVWPFLVKHCHECHGNVPKPKAGLRLDQLAPNFDNRASREKWLAVLDQLQTLKMPPEPKPRPPEREAKALVDWIGAQVKAADAKRVAEGRVVMRRLNRNEYENTVHDLLGIDADLKQQLSADGSADGFDNVGSALHTSSFLMEKYLEAADKALNLAIVNRPKPPVVKRRYFCKDQHQVKVASERVFRQLDDTTVLFASSPWQAVGISQFYPSFDSQRGYYRFRISASAYQSGGKSVTFRVTSSTRGRELSGKNGVVGYFDAPADKPTVFEFVEYIELRNSITILPYGLAGSITVHKAGADKWEGPGLAVDWVDIEGPLNDTWPPAGHRDIFGDLAQKPAPIYNSRDRVEVVSDQPEADAERILRRFVRRAFRRAVTDDDIKPFLTLVKKKLADKDSFEQAVRVGLLSVMVSPQFLFLQEKPGKLDDFALASRLSYFLWSTMPDEELLNLAEQKKLSEPDTLRQQVTRMVKHPKAAAFTENFVGQWLNLREIDFTEPSHIYYPEFDHMLKVSMIRETELFFEEVLKNDLSLTNFVASDFTMLNGRLAKHYGIPGAEGWEFRKVKLPADSHRGGVLTMASVLKVTANGTYTSPVARGVFVLDKLLGTPPSPPPEGVAAFVPDIRGATTIREQLAKHRQQVTCASCHAKIDPAGFALESFDVIGGWREFYRTSGNGKAVVIDGRRMQYLQGKPVDPSDVLPDGQKFQNIDDLKLILLKDKDQLARALTVKLLTYATGGPPETNNKPEIEAIVAAVREKNYGFRTLVHEIVQSNAFQTK